MGHLRDADGSALGRCHEDRIDAAIAALASRQENLISTAQLAALGLGRSAVAKRVRSGRLHPNHRGVFAVGTPLLPPLGRERAALLAAPGTVRARGSAGATLGVLPPHPSGPVELLGTTNRRSRPGIVVHRTNDLPATDVRIHRGLPLTSPARLVLDLASHLSAAPLERLVAEVLVIDQAARRELLDRGSAKLRSLLDAGPRRTRSATERLLLRIVRDARLPVPQTNAMVLGEEVDAFWPDHGVVVEVDAYGTHGDRAAFERDRRKRTRLTAAGLTVLAVTDRRLDAEPLAIAATIAQTLVRDRTPPAALLACPA